MRPLGAPQRRVEPARAAPCIVHAAKGSVALASAFAGGRLASPHRLSSSCLACRGKPLLEPHHLRSSAQLLAVAKVVVLAAATSGVAALDSYIQCCLLVLMYGCEWPAGVVLPCVVCSVQALGCSPKPASSSSPAHTVTALFILEGSPVCMPTCCAASTFAAHHCSLAPHTPTPTSCSLSGSSRSLRHLPAGGAAVQRGCHGRV